MSGRKTQERTAPRAQATLSNLERELSVFVRRALRHLWNDEGSESGLDRWTYAMLVRLSEDGPMRVGEVARRFGIDKSTASRHLTRLEENGLVEALPDTQDARSTILRLTDRGTERLAVARAARMEPLRRVFAAWPEEERQALARLLGRLNSDLDALAERTHAGQSTSARG